MKWRTLIGVMLCGLMLSGCFVAIGTGRPPFERLDERKEVLEQRMRELDERAEELEMRQRELAERERRLEEESR